MEVVQAVSCIICLLTVTASPEISSKGKHMHLGDKSHTVLEDADMPRFAEPVANVTVSIGRDALLACVVENLKGFKVAWVRVDTQTILSIHHNVISQNSRISLTYNDHRSWYLHIKEVEESDRGWYMCQVNTDPMRSRKGYLQVVVPPMIVEGMTSNDLVVREGLNVTLVCKARGYPEPYVMWRREDGEEMLIGGEHVNVVDGELLHITKVSRLHMAAYLCVASNGVPPSISKRVHLRVQFPPMLSIPNQLEGAYVGQDVVLECHTEAYPASINYWTTERGDMIISDTSRAGDKYETTSTVNGYTKYMKLKIRNVAPNDFGTYRCVAKNSLGETDGNIKLDEMPAPTTAILSEMAMLNRSLGTMFSRKSNAGDNNQAPMRNPPDAFHNSAGALAQYNLVGVIIQAIKMQSLGIFKRLTNLIQTINECATTTCPRSGDKETTEIIRIKRNTTTTNIIRKYVYEIQKLTDGLAASLLKIIKSTVSTLRQQREQQQIHYSESGQPPRNLIIENEFKNVKQPSTQETHISLHRKLRRTRSCSLQDNALTTLNKQHLDNSHANYYIYYIQKFHNHIKQQEVLHKFNSIYLRNVFNKIRNANTHNKCRFSTYKRNTPIATDIFYCFTALFFSAFSLTLFLNLVSKSCPSPLKFLTDAHRYFLSHHLLAFLLQQLFLVVATNVLGCTRTLLVVNFTFKILNSLYYTLNLFSKPTPSINTITSPLSTRLSLTQLSSAASPASPASPATSACSTLLFGR